MLLCVLVAVCVSAPVFAGQPGAPAPFVTVGKVAEAPDVEMRRYTGHVTHTASVNLVARVSGELLKMNFHEGDMVREGQVLFELDPIRYEAAVKNAEAGVAENQARVAYAEITYDRSKSLFEQRATSKDSMDASESELAAFRAAVAAAEANLITCRDDLKNTRIIAPISGKIGRSNYTEGNYVTPSSGIIATLIQMDPLRIAFAISNRDFLSLFGTEEGLKNNALLRLRLADDSLYEYEGKVEFIDNQVHQRTDSVQVYASFANPEGRLIPGGTVTVQLSRRTGEMIPAVIPSAVMHDASTAYVYVVDADNKIERREVALGPINGRAQLVRSGLSVGEMIVVDGMHKAMPGMAIRPDFADAAYSIAQGESAAIDAAAR